MSLEKREVQLRCSKFYSKDCRTNVGEPEYIARLEG